MQVSSDYPLTAYPHLPIWSKASMTEFLMLTAGILITQNPSLVVICVLIIKKSLD